MLLIQSDDEDTQIVCSALRNHHSCAASSAVKKVSFADTKLTSTSFHKIMDPDSWRNWNTDVTVPGRTRREIRRAVEDNNVVNFTIAES